MATPKGDSNTIRQMAQDLREQLVKDRRYLHQIPEIGTDLPETSAYIKKRLDEMGIPWKDCGGPLPEKMTEDYMAAGFPRMEKETGVIASIGSGEPCILLRADMDALPIKEDTPLEFKSVNGYGHMCGHDAHAAMLLGAAQILKQMEDSLPGTVKLMFQPGEETGAGARLMVEDGLLENPAPGAAFGIHVQPSDTTGQAGYAMGVNSASLDTFILKIRGNGGHSSQPQLCTDPLIVMNQVYQAVNLLVGRETDPAAMVALTCGVAKGGAAVNIIPDEAELHIGVRTLNVEAAEHLKKRIPELIDHYVKAWNADYTLTTFHTPCTLTNELLCQELVPCLKEVLGGSNVHQIPAMSATEDFGYVTEKVPGMFVFLGAGAPDSAPLHSPQMVLDEDVLPLGAALHANVAISWLKSHKNSL
ncbi:peptidase M20 [Eubacterium sp. An11]|uniref:M20 metallopeptidase family protein n=1 Tax=Eubacterium sp. An11 TaxID=1965542 RepID=UPI000B3990B5|nr:M20 family metallopeptidase [Eubacterium sp. An11]OUQ70268.1 peptidase M20 [Eubacterium sp. An11]